MNTKARYFWMRSLGLTGITILLAGLVAVRGQSAIQNNPTRHGAISAEPRTRCKYSSLRQINKTNVSKLELAWFLPAPGPAGRFSFNPGAGILCVRAT